MLHRASSSSFQKMEGKCERERERERPTKERGIIGAVTSVCPPPLPRLCKATFPSAAGKHLGSTRSAGGGEGIAHAD